MTTQAKTPLTHQQAVHALVLLEQIDCKPDDDERIEAIAAVVRSMADEVFILRTALGCTVCQEKLLPQGYAPAATLVQIQEPVR